MHFIQKNVFVINIGNSSKYIYKISLADDTALELEREFIMIRYMASINEIFNTFMDYQCQTFDDNIIYLLCDDKKHFYNIENFVENPKYFLKNGKFTMMFGFFNPNLMTMYDYCQLNTYTLINNIYKILNIVNNVFRPNHFIHGDLKLDNIMIDNNNHNIKIIDLDFSLIVNNVQKIIINNYKISLYLGENLILCERYLQIFDIYILCTSLLISMDLPNIDNFIQQFLINDYNETILDFVTILIYLNTMNKNKFINKNNNIIGKFTFINKLLLTIIDHNFNNHDLNNHIKKIQDIIMKNMALNTKFDTFENLITVLPVQNTKLF